jgi:hypothetical protein
VVLLLVIALVVGVIPIGVVVLVGGVELLPLGIVSDEVGGVAALESTFHFPSPFSTHNDFQPKLHSPAHSAFFPNSFSLFPPVHSTHHENSAHSLE